MSINISQKTLATNLSDERVVQIAASASVEDAEFVDMLKDLVNAFGIVLGAKIGVDSAYGAFAQILGADADNDYTLIVVADSLNEISGLLLTVDEICTSTRRVAGAQLRAKFEQHYDTALAGAIVGLSGVPEA